MATARSDQLQALAQCVADALPPEVVEVALTGSVSRGVADDVDRAREWLAAGLTVLAE